MSTGQIAVRVPFNLCKTSYIPDSGRCPCNRRDASENPRRSVWQHGRLTSSTLQWERANRSAVCITEVIEQ